MKKRVCAGLVILSAMLSMTGCGSGGGSGDAEELNVFIWTEYVPDSVVEAFEDRGIRSRVYFMVGGYFMDEEQAREIGADCYTEDACACAEEAYRYLMKKGRRKRYQ